MFKRLYEKVNGRYKEVSWVNSFDLNDGIWLVQSKPESKRYSSVFWKVGNIERPVDVVTHAALQSIEEDLSMYLRKLGDTDSKEYKEATELAGGYIQGPISYYNVSAADLCSLFLRRIALHLEDGENMSWDSLQYKFREECIVSHSPNFDLQVHLLYQFTDWLKKNNIKFRQGKNIG